MSDFSKLDALLHKTRIKVLQVLWFQFSTGMMNHSVKEATVGVEVAGNRERGWKEFDKGGGGGKVSIGGVFIKYGCYNPSANYAQMMTVKLLKTKLRQQILNFL